MATPKAIIPRVLVLVPSLHPSFFSRRGLASKDVKLYLLLSCAQYGSDPFADWLHSRTVHGSSGSARYVEVDVPQAEHCLTLIMDPSYDCYHSFCRFCHRCVGLVGAFTSIISAANNLNITVFRCFPMRLPFTGLKTRDCGARQQHGCT